MTRRRPQRSTPWALLVAAGLLLQACGGGGGEGVATAPSTGVGDPPAPQISGDSPVPSGCGMPASGTLFRNAEVEPFAVSVPGSPTRLLAAWQQDRYSDGGAAALVTAISDDSGASWRRQLQPMSRCGGAAAGSSTDFGRVSDPWVDAAPDGTLHLLGLALTGGVLAAGSSSAVLASRSVDGGRTWSAPQVLQRDGSDFFNDKDAITADALDAHYVYAVWDRLNPKGNGPAMLARSVDGGLSWEPARVLYAPVPQGGADGVSQTLGNRIVTVLSGGQAGVLVNVFNQIDTVNGASTARVGVVRSSDHGLTWSAPVFIADLRAVGTTDPASGHAVRDGADLPTIAAGPDGSLWVAWQDARFSSGKVDGIALSRSTDGGQSWSAAVAINRVGSTQAFTPTLHVRADGLIGLLHFDLRNDTAAASLLADAWLLTSRDGITWNETHVAGSFDLSGAPDAEGWFLGDYQGLTSTGNDFVPVLVLAYGGAGNRTDVFAPKVQPPGVAAAHQHVARAAPAHPVDSVAFVTARQQALQRLLTRRHRSGQGADDPLR